MGMLHYPLYHQRVTVRPSQLEENSSKFCHLFPEHLQFQALTRRSGFKDCRAGIAFHRLESPAILSASSGPLAVPDPLWCLDF